MVGGLVAAGAFVPFTLAHGPTSTNLDRQVLRWDMHDWGLLLGTIPPLLVGAGWGRYAGSSPPAVPSRSVSSR